MAVDKRPGKQVIRIAAPTPARTHVLCFAGWDQLPEIIPWLASLLALSGLPHLLQCINLPASRPSGDSDNHVCRLAQRELRRVSAITSQTLRFHKQATNPLAVTSQDLMNSVVLTYQGRIVNARIHIEERYRAHQPVRCFEGEIRQVLSNLVNNAIDAIPPKGGRLLLRSRAGTDWSTGRHGLVLTVADTGIGMSRSVLARVFEPFYTTKGAIGTGLGLWVSQEIVKRHEGALHVRSSQNPGHSGTVFIMFLPFVGATRGEER